MFFFSEKLIKFKSEKCQKCSSVCQIFDWKPSFRWYWNSLTWLICENTIANKNHVFFFQFLYRNQSWNANIAVHFRLYYVYQSTFNICTVTVLLLLLLFYVQMLVCSFLSFFFVVPHFSLASIANKHAHHPGIHRK